MKIVDKFKLISKNKIFIVLFLALTLVVGLFFRFYAMTKGHNFDFESYKIVGQIVVSGGNVYHETVRYNYGPIWSVILGFFWWVSSWFSSQEVVFRILIVALLSSADIAIAFILKKKYGMVAFIVFFLNPISIIITGYHNQFDNLALLMGMLGILLYPKSDLKATKAHFFSAALIGVSLMTKHIFFILPIWLFFRAKTLKTKLIALFVPLVMFGVSFLPFLSEGKEGIIQNVFLYKSFANAPLLHLLFSDQIVHFINPTIFLIAALMLTGILVRKLPIFESLLWYTLALVICSPAIANQYLAIAMPAVIGFGVVLFVPYIYTATALLVVTSPDGLRINKFAPLFERKILQFIAPTSDLSQYRLIIALLFIGTVVYAAHHYAKRFVRALWRRAKEEISFQLASLKR